MSDRQKRKEWKFIMSYYKEVKWLEQMAEEGWFLENVSLGIRYMHRKQCRNGD